MRKAWVWFAYDLNDKIVAKGTMRTKHGRPDVPFALKADPVWNAVYRSWQSKDDDYPYRIEAYARRANGYINVEQAHVGYLKHGFGL